MTKPWTPAGVSIVAALALLAAGCGASNDPTGGVAERSAATQAAQAERNLAAARTAQPPPTPRP